MIALYLLLTAAAPAPAAIDPLGDTTRTMSVRRGDRLEVQGRTGDITIRTTARGDVRLLSEWRGEVTQSGGVLRLDGTSRRSWADEEDLVLEVPTWMAISVNSLNGDVTIEGADARIDVETVDGDIRVRGARGGVALHAVSGELRLSQARGRMELNSVNGGIHVSNAEGELQAETVNDDITLMDVRSDDVSATTVNGDLQFGGTLSPSGIYKFTTHNGDITLHLPGSPDATVAVATFNGDFESDFPVTVRERRGKRFTVPLGRGTGARLELETFQGSIQLSKQPMSMAPSRD